MAASRPASPSRWRSWWPARSARCSSSRSAGVDPVATRAEDELDVARAAFYEPDGEPRGSSIALATLVTELPVFRAHLTARGSPPTAHHRRDGRRLSSPARRHFVVVTTATARWLANPGGRVRRRTAPASSAAIADGAPGHIRRRDRRRRAASCSSCSAPARFADEVLGTLTAGYRLTDAWPRSWPDWRSARSS